MAAATTSLTVVLHLVRRRAAADRLGLRCGWSLRLAAAEASLFFFVKVSVHWVLQVENAAFVLILLPTALSAFNVIYQDSTF